MVATAIAVAFVVFSCKGKLSEAKDISLSDAPSQIIENVFAAQSEDGILQMRMEAQLMERYDNDSTTYELFPEGFYVYGYTDVGELETLIRSDKAKHIKNKKTNAESWEAFGNVLIENVLKMQSMESDTIYWDREKHEIYTDCYVKMYSDDGFMQGIGLRSDERARNAIILKPFNSYGVVVKDSTKVVIDTLNFIGPLQKK